MVIGKRAPAIVRHILEDKGKQEIFSVDPNDTVLSAIRKMRDNQLGAMLVMVREQLVGILTERDYLYKVELEGKTAKETLVKEIMTPAPVQIAIDETPIQVAIVRMDDHHIRHLPVLHGQAVGGVISQRDLLHALRDYQVFHEDERRSYMLHQT